MRIATFAVTVLLCIGMTAPEVFGEPGSPPAAADDAALLGQLKARDPLLQEVRSGGSDSKLIGLFGDLADAQPNKPAVVQGFVTQYGTLLGFPAGGMPGDMQLQPEGQREKGVTLTYVPTKGGVSYKKGAVQFGFAPNGKLMTATGRFKSAAGADMGGLSAEDAAKKALTEMHAMYPGSWLGGAGKLIETLEDTDDGKGIRRVWRVVAALGDRRRPVRVRLGPGGEVLDKGSSAETASGKVYTSYPDSAMGDGDLPKLFVDSIPFLRGMWGHHFLADSSSPMYARVDSADRADYDPVSYTVPASGSTPARTWWDPRFLEVNVYHHLMIGHDKAIGWGMSEVDNQTVKFDVYYAGYDDNADYTHYDGVDHLRFARDNAPCDYRSPAQDMSVIYHEYGHYVQAALNPSRSAGGSLADQCESFAIGEGWSDVFANAITGKTTQGEPWQTGTADAHFIRDAANPPGGKDYCSMFPCWYSGTPKPAGSQSECHDAGVLFSALCESMRRECFRGDGNWLMLRLGWAMRDTPGPQTMQRFCQSMLTDEILYCSATDDAKRSRFVKMYQLMQGLKLYNRTCP